MLIAPVVARDVEARAKGGHCKVLDHKREQDWGILGGVSC